MIYTGIINELINEGQNLTFPLIRVSYPFKESNSHNVLMNIPRIWYRMVGPRNSTESLIIMLLNDRKDSKHKYRIKHCSMNDSRWEPIFKEFIILHEKNVILCQLKIEMIDTYENETLLPENSIYNPTQFIIDNIFY